MINLLRLSRFPIYHQLVLEEALLRGTAQNWCIINDGAFSPAIVMGISGYVLILHANYPSMHMAIAHVSP